ncbi:MAG: hypothetical protein HYX50_00560 [Chloroflexi bacterium]|nr:hypothetical protein [Chloroflexota bacterium]
MFGTIFKMQAKPGKAQELKDFFLKGERRPAGMQTAFLLSEGDGDVVWGFASFANEEEYRANAADPAQHAEYEKYRALLTAEPEWHDGSVEEMRT